MGRGRTALYELEVRRVTTITTSAGLTFRIGLRQRRDLPLHRLVQRKQVFVLPLRVDGFGVGIDVFAQPLDVLAALPIHTVNAASMHHPAMNAVLRRPAV